MRKDTSMSLAKDCYGMKLELLTNSTVVDDAIRFVSKNSRDNAKLKSSSEGDKEESKEPDYEEDGDQLEEELDWETGETTSATAITFSEEF